MTYSKINYAGLPTQQYNYDWIANAMKNILEGYKMAGEPGRLDRADKRDKVDTQYYEPTKQEELLKSILGNKKTEITNQYEAPSAEADIAYKKAMAEKALHPELAERLSGPAAESNSIQLLEDKYGKDSEIVKRAKALFDANLRNRESLVPYRQHMTDTIDIRAATQLGKTEAERADVEAGFAPNTSRTKRLTPARQKELQGRYDLKEQKDTTDQDSRKKALFATNIDKTLDTINPKALSRFSGLKGHAELMVQQRLAAVGKESKEYDDYLLSATAAMQAASQFRQFYGESIQPSVKHDLEVLANPSTWDRSPALALKLYEQYKGILRKETGTYRGALTSTAVFKAPGDQQARRSRYNPQTGALE